MATRFLSCRRRTFRQLTDTRRVQRTPRQEDSAGSHVVDPEGRIRDLPIRIVAQIPPAGSQLSRLGVMMRAEDVGADAIFGYDHFMVPAVTGRDENGGPSPPRTRLCSPTSRAGTALASWAEITSRAELGLLVGGGGFATPTCSRTWPAPSTTSVAVTSTLVGAGWYQLGYRDLDDFGTVSSRHAVFIDALERIQDRLTKLVPPPPRRSRS